jgi:hypothetical protein
MSTDVKFGVVVLGRVAKSPWSSWRRADEYWWEVWDDYEEEWKRTESVPTEIRELPKDETVSDGKKVVVTGGRGYLESDVAWETLERLKPSRVAQGGCHDGADLYARMWAKKRGVTLTTYFADWDEYGKSAGPRRNTKMLDDFKPDLVIAFPGGNGTADCVRKARRAGIKLMTVLERRGRNEDMT